MSLDINVYTENLSDRLIPKISERLNEFDMKVEIHPEFSFETQTGFLPFKFSLNNTSFDILKNQTLISGFEMYIDHYDFKSERKGTQPKTNLIKKIFQKQNTIETATSEIENKLEKCTKVLTFLWSAGDTFELRFALLVSAIITELTNGVMYYPADDYWYEDEDIVGTAFKDIKDYENSVSNKEVIFHEFNNW